MKRNYVLFGVILAISLNVFTSSCRSDDGENFPNSKSKRIKEIKLEWIDRGTLYNLSAFLSYNSKNQLDHIFYTEKSGLGNNILIDYYNKKIYMNEEELCTFELNNWGYIESITPNNPYQEKRIFEYDADGYLIKMKEFSGHDEYQYLDRMYYKYEKGNLVKVEYLMAYLGGKSVDYKVYSDLTFSYSDELNVNGIPAYVYSLGSSEEYFYIHRNVHILMKMAMYYVGLFGKSPKNLCRYCEEDYNSSRNWGTTFKNSYDENGNLTKIADLSTNNSYSWIFVY